jgi:FkbM family methyltransferase
VCHPHAYRVAFRSQIADREQREEFQSFMFHCSRGMFFFDIGAHFGVFSLAAAHFGGRAIAIDPSPIAARMIAIQSGLNGFSDSIRIIQAAVTDQAGAVDMLSSGVFSDGFFKIAQGRARRELTAVPAITIDQLVDQYGPPTHVKIDVEGQEGAVLRGGRTALSQYSPTLFLELHNAMIASEGGDPAQALDELVELKYAMLALNGNPLKREFILRKPLIRIVAMKAQSRPTTSR